MTPLDHYKAAEELLRPDGVTEDEWGERLREAQVHATLAAAGAAILAAPLRTDTAFND